MYDAAPIVPMPLYKEAPVTTLPPPWACNRTVCATQEWDVLAARDEIDGRALDEIATLDVTHLNLLNVARAGVLVGVSALRLGRALHPDEVYLFAYLLGNLPNLERLVFEGDLDEMETCAAEIMLHVNLRHNPLLASITVNFGHPHRSQTSACVKRPPVKLRQPQTWIALLALRWPQGAVSLEHRIYAQGPRNGTRVYGPWKATLHPLPMLSPTHDVVSGAPLEEGDERSPFVGRMHVLKFFREQDLRPSDGAKGGRRAHRRVPKDRVVVCATTFTDFESAEEFLRDNASDDDDDLDDEIESDDDLDSDEGYDTDDVDLMDIDDEPFGGSSLHTPEEYF